MSKRDTDSRIVWRDITGRAYVYSTCTICDTITLVRLNRIRTANVRYCSNTCRLEDLKQGHTKNYHLEHEARLIFRKAYRDGLIYRPTKCFKCNSEYCFEKFQAHHEDYSKPLEVIWLCTSCHRLYHIALGQE